MSGVGGYLKTPLFLNPDAVLTHDAGHPVAGAHDALVPKLLVHPGTAIVSAALGKSGLDVHQQRAVRPFKKLLGQGRMSTKEKGCAGE